MTGRLRALCLLGATGATAAVVAGLIVWSGRRVPRPEDASVAALGTWHRSLGPDEVLVVVLWGAAGALAAWLALAMALQAAAAACGGRALRLTADLVSPRSLQRLGHSLAGLSLTAGLTVAPSAGFLDPPGPEPPPTTVTGALEQPTGATGTATMVRVDPAGRAAVPTTVGPTTTVTPAPTAGDPPQSSVDGREVPTSPSPPVPVAPSTTVPPANPPGPGTALPEPGDAPLPTAPPAVPVVPRPHAPAPEAPALVGASIVVEPGMSFWSIAEEVLTETGAMVHQRDLHRYWLALIEANRDRLVVPGNPDLLLPGQSLVLPPR